MEQRNSQTKFSLSKYWFLQERCKNIFIYLSYYERDKNVLHNHFIYHYIEKLVCLFCFVFLNKSFQAQWFFVNITCKRPNNKRLNIGWLVVLCLKTFLYSHFVLIISAVLQFWLILKLYIGKWRQSKMWLIIDCWPDTSLIPSITLVSHGVLNRKELCVWSQGLFCPKLLKGICLPAFMTPEMLCPPMW